MNLGITDVPMYYKKMLRIAVECGSTRVMTQSAMLEFSDYGQLNTFTIYQPLELPVADEQPPPVPSQYKLQCTDTRPPPPPFSS